MTRFDAAAAWCAALAAACGAVVVVVTLVHEPRAFLLALLIYNAIVVAGLAGIVLTPYAIRDARAAGRAVKRLPVAAAMMLPGLLWSANVAYGADSWAADVAFVAALAGAVFAVAAIGLYVVGRGLSRTTGMSRSVRF